MEERSIDVQLETEEISLLAMDEMIEEIVRLLEKMERRLAPEVVR